MNDNIRLYATNVEDRLKQAYKAGGYNKKFGYEGMNTSNMDEDWETKSQKSAGNMSTRGVRDLYYNMLTESEVWQLYTFYKADFDLFEYEVDPKYLIKYYKEKEE